MRSGICASLCVNFPDFSERGASKESFPFPRPGPDGSGGEEEVDDAVAELEEVRNGHRAVWQLREKGGGSPPGGLGLGVVLALDLLGCIFLELARPLGLRSVGGVRAFAELTPGLAAPRGDRKGRGGTSGAEVRRGIDPERVGAALLRTAAAGAAPAHCPCPPYAVHPCAQLTVWCWAGGARSSSRGFSATVRSGSHMSTCRSRALAITTRTLSIPTASCLLSTTDTGGSTRRCSHNGSLRGTSTRQPGRQTTQS